MYSEFNHPERTPLHSIIWHATETLDLNFNFIYEYINIWKCCDIYLLDQTSDQVFLFFLNFDLIDPVSWIKSHLFQRAEAVISMATQNFYQKYEQTTTKRLQAKTIKIQTFEKETGNFILFHYFSFKKWIYIDGFSPRSEEKEIIIDFPPVYFTSQRKKPMIAI